MSTDLSTSGDRTAINGETSTFYGGCVGAKDFTDVVRRALMIYDVLSEVVKDEGCRVMIRYPDGKLEEMNLDLFGPPKG